MNPPTTDRDLADAIRALAMDAGRRRAPRARMYNPLMTNRELYQAVAHLTETQREGGRTLEEYLRALLGLVARHGGQASLSPRELFSLLSDAFTAEPVPRDAAQAARDPEGGSSAYGAFREVLRGQIVDLVQMEQAGTLKDEQRYFGVSAPSGAQWYNFDPCTYLECAMAGTLGGWEAGDGTGRELVPGPVAVMNEAGQVEAVDPRDLEEPIVPLGAISWDLLRDFLDAGQMYE